VSSEIKLNRDFAIGFVIACPDFSWEGVKSQENSNEVADFGLKAACAILRFKGKPYILNDYNFGLMF